MKKITKFTAAAMAAIMTVSGLSATAFGAEKLVAFPGAEGGGMYTLGARAASNMRVYHVTNLNDSGTGSLRAGLMGGNKIIVFDVAGTIHLKSDLKVNASNITVLGQTAPGEGICIAGESVRFQGGSNIILRYLRFRSGDTAVSQEDGLGFKDCTDVIVDHCSISWSVDECLSAYANRNFTAQYCIISESLNESIHSKGDHGYGGIWGGENASFHHNLIASHNSRTPRIGTSATVSSYLGHPDTDSLIDIRNNVFYNWGRQSGYGGENGVRVNLVNNYYKMGPATKKAEIYKSWGTTLYVSGNVMEDNDPMTADNWLGVSDDGSAWTKCESISDGIMVDGVLKANDEFIYDYPVTTTDAESAYEEVLAEAGASLWRDVTDTRVINNVINGTATNGSNGSVGLIDSQEDVGGWVWLYEGEKPADSDNDGMSDAWEDANGLDRNNAADALEISPSGYTNLELYAESITGQDNSLDRTKLNTAVNSALELDRSLYEEAELERLDAAIDEAKQVYAEATTQTALDDEADRLNDTIAGLGFNVTEQLRLLLEELRGTTAKADYLPAGEAAFTQAYNKAESDLQQGADETVLRDDYDALKKAYEELIPSDEGELREIMELAKSYIDSGEYGESDIRELRAAVNSADGMFSTSQDYTNEDIHAHIDEIQALIDELLSLNRTVMDEYIDMLEGGVLNSYALDENSAALIDDLLAEAKELKANGSDEDAAREFAKRMFASAREFKYNDYKEILSLQDFSDYTPGTGSEIITEGDNKYLAPVEQEVFYTETEGISADDYFSSDFMFPSDQASGACQAMGFVLEDGIKFLAHVRKNATGNDTVTLGYYDSDAGTISGETYTLSIEDDIWHNITVKYDSSNGYAELYYDNLMLYSGTPEGFGTGHGKVTAYGTVDSSFNLIEGISLPMYGHFAVYVDNYTRYKAGRVWLNILGDADASGILTANDCVTILRKSLDSSYMMPVEEYTDDYLSCADVNGDGILTASDTAMVLQKVLNNDFTFPVEG